MGKWRGMLCAACDARRRISHVLCHRVTCPNREMWRWIHGPIWFRLERLFNYFPTFINKILFALHIIFYNIYLQSTLLINIINLTVLSFKSIHYLVKKILILLAGSNIITLTRFNSQSMQHLFWENKIVIVLNS